MPAEEQRNGEQRIPPSTEHTEADHLMDSLARGLSTGAVSRGKALRWMAGSLLGGALAAVPGVALAAPGNAPQGRCPAGFTNCRGECVILAEDRNNCGACRVICPEGRSCSNGLCCPTGQLNCGGSCTDVQSDLNNCGKCGVTCAQGGVCVNGGCQCPFGQLNCGGTCVDLDDDPNNCGACGFKCPQGGTCQAGRCMCTVTAPYYCGDPPTSSGYNGVCTDQSC